MLVNKIVGLVFAMTCKTVLTNMRKIKNPDKIEIVILPLKKNRDMILLPYYQALV